MRWPLPRLISMLSSMLALIRSERQAETPYSSCRLLLRRLRRFWNGAATSSIPLSSGFFRFDWHSARASHEAIENYPWKAISRYIQTLRSKRSIQDVLAVIYESFVSRFINGLVYRSPAPITRAVLLLIIPVLTPRRAHSFKRRFCSALRFKYLSQWSPSSLVIPTTFFNHWSAARL